MTTLAGGSAYPARSFRAVGETIKGVILDANDVQARDFNTRQPKFWEDGNPVMQVRLTLEAEDGSKSSFYIQAGQMMKDARGGLASAGMSDVEQMTYMEATRTGGAGRKGDPYTYEFKFTPFDPEA